MKEETVDAVQTVTIGSMTKDLLRGRDEHMRNCIQNCLSAHQACEHLIRYCLRRGGEHAEAKHQVLLMDVAQITSLAADFMLRESELHARTCEACADVCDACASELERFTVDEIMKHAAEVCRQCARTCREMAQGPH